jgi:hypothetical protein
MQSVQQTDRKRRARAHAAPRRQVSVMVNLHTTVDAQKPKRLANRRMGNLVQALAIFYARVDQSNPMFEKRRQVAARQITILVYGGSQNRAAVVAIPYRIICASAEK